MTYRLDYLRTVVTDDIPALPKSAKRQIRRAIESKLDTSCTVAVSGNEICITSIGSYESDRRGRGCKDDCNSLSARCTSEGPLAPGDYAVVHGEGSGELTLPASAVAVDLDDRVGFPCFF